MPRRHRSRLPSMSRSRRPSARVLRHTGGRGGVCDRFSDQSDAVRDRCRPDTGAAAHRTPARTSRGCAPRYARTPSSAPVSTRPPPRATGRPLKRPNPSTHAPSPPQIVFRVAVAWNALNARTTQRLPHIVARPTTPIRPNPRRDGSRCRRPPPGRRGRSRGSVTPVTGISCSGPASKCCAPTSRTRRATDVPFVQWLSASRPLRRSVCTSR